MWGVGVLSDGRQARVAGRAAVPKLRPPSRPDAAGQGRPGDDGADEAMRLVELFRAVDDGTLPLDHACQRASKLGAEHAITPAALDALSEEAFKRAPVSSRQPGSLSR